MNYQVAFLALLLNLHRLYAQYSVGYGLNPYAPQLPPQNNHIVYNIANSADANDDERSPYSTHRPMPLSIWSGTPIVVGGDYGNGNSQASGKQHQHQEYNERSSDRLTPAYLPTNFYNSFLDTQSRRDNIEPHQQQQPLLEEEEEDVGRQQQVVYTTRATNHNYDNVANKLQYENHNSDNNEDDNDYYNRQQLIRGSSRRGSVHGQPEVFATAVSTALPSGVVTTSRQIGNYFGRVGAGSYYEPPLPLQLQSEQRANSANYAKHFANYLRKYPQRLQPIYNSNNYTIKK